MRSTQAATIAAILVSATCAAPVFAQSRTPNLYAYATLANDYRYRGLSVVESGASWQIGADYEHASGFFAGAFAANVDYEVEPPYGEEREYVVDYYLGYSFGRRKWRTSVGLGGYEYGDTAVNYSYDEWRFSTRFMNRMFYSAGYTDALYSRDYSAWYHELGFAQPLPRDFELSGSIGELDTDLLAEGGYTHWNVGISKVLKHVGVDLRFHEASLDEVSVLGDPAGDRWVLSVSYGFAPGSQRGTDR